MQTIERDIPLQPLNTFGIAATAGYFIRADSVAVMQSALAWAREQGLRVIVLGAGSNILFTADVDALVLLVTNKGVTARSLSGGRVLVSAAAGEYWPDLVWWAVQQGYGGIENLCQIPGTVGGAAVQNIGAYGVELCDVCHSVEALDRRTGESRVFSVEDCRYGYRDSLFKQEPDSWLITRLHMLLDSKAPLHTQYRALQEALEARDKPEAGETRETSGAGIASSSSVPLDFAGVARLVESIRKSKLPAPEELGNAGSFFTNPVIAAASYETLLQTYPTLPGVALADGTVKLSAAWLIAAAGYGGKAETQEKNRAKGQEGGRNEDQGESGKESREGDRVGCYHKQPLVLVNYGGASGDDVLRFSRKIQADVARLFGVSLKREVVVYP